MYMAKKLANKKNMYTDGEFTVFQINNEPSLHRRLNMELVQCKRFFTSSHVGIGQFKDQQLNDLMPGATLLNTGDRANVSRLSWSMQIGHSRFFIERLRHNGE